VLGYRARDVSGVPLLTGVHPGDLSNLLTGLAHVQATARDAVVRLRVRHRNGSWLMCRCRLGALEQGPGFAFTLRPVVESDQSPAERARELEARLARIARELHGTGLSFSPTATPALADMPQLADLTSREWEVLTRIGDGHRVPRIASDLSLSPSTVRNHLSSIFGKLDVGSQSELLDLLRQREQSEQV
jgi:DNA-binding CsgD family transcriptional regulator